MICQTGHVIIRKQLTSPQIYRTVTGVIYDAIAAIQLIQQCNFSIRCSLTPIDGNDRQIGRYQSLDLIVRAIEIDTVVDVRDQNQRLGLSRLFISDDFIDDRGGFRDCSDWQSTDRHLWFSVAVEIDE